MATTPVFWIGRNVVATLRKDAEYAGLGEYDEQGRRTTFHGFRASMATILANAGVVMAVAMRIMRHSDPRLTMKTYAKVESLRDGHRELKKLCLAPTPADTNCAPLAAASGNSAPRGGGPSDQGATSLAALG